MRSISSALDRLSGNHERTDEQDKAIEEIIKEAKRIIKMHSGFEIDDETAEELVTQSIEISDLNDREELEIYDPEAAWEMQMLGARIAAILGFDGVSLRDEYGTSYAIWLDGRDHLLIECTDEEDE